MLLHSATVAVEVLFGLWLLLAWASVSAYLRGQGGFVRVGACLALAYLCKANGLFLVPVALLAGFHRERFRFLARRDFWLGVAVFLLITFPLIVRNLRVYGKPFYNVNQSVLWLDDWNQRFATESAVSEPTFADYRRAHTTGQALRRLAGGGMQQGVYSVVAAGETTLLHERFGWKVWPVGLVFWALAAASLWRRQDRHATLPAALMIAGFNLFFAWYPVKDVRFVVPLLPILFILAARGLHITLRGLRGRVRAMKRLRPWSVSVTLAALVVGATVALPPPAQGEAKALTAPPGYMELLTWMRANVPEDAVVMAGPSHAYNYFWTDPPGRWVATPWVASMEALQAEAEKKRVSYILVDASNALATGEGVRGIPDA